MPSANTEQMISLLGRAESAAFGKKPGIVGTDFPCTTFNQTAYCYIRDHAWPVNDPDAQVFLANIPNHGEYFYLIFESRLDKQVEEAIFGRPHIKSRTVIASMCCKAIWLRTLCLLRQKSDQPDDFEYQPFQADELAALLPIGFEFGIEYFGLSNIEVIEVIQAQEHAGYQAEMGDGIAAFQSYSKAPSLEWYVDASTISLIAVRCPTEESMYVFLAMCVKRMLDPER